MKQLSNIKLDLLQLIKPCRLIISFAVLSQITAPIDLIAEYKLFSTNFNLENIIPPSREIHRTTMEAIDTICTVILRIVEKLESYNHDSGIVVFRVNI